MGFWESFKNGYRTTRNEVSGHPLFEDGLPAYEDRESADPPLDGFEAPVHERDQQLEESKQLIADLAAELQRREEELKVLRRSAPRTSADDKYKKLRRAVMQLVHPDKVSGNVEMTAVLEAICKDLNAEIQKIEAA